MSHRKGWCLTLVALLLASAVGACARSDAAKEDVEDAVRASFRAENGKDIDAFLALWTDKGLDTYEVGSRKELEDPKSEQAKGFGEQQAHIVRFEEIEVSEDKATAVVDAGLDGSLAGTVFRLKYELIEKDGDWLFNGFEFVGSPPPSGETEVVDIKALEYGFVLSKNTVDGDIALKFSNIGKQQHELAFFQGPDGVDVSTAKKALQDVDGGTLEPLPKGYKADHLSFAEPGESMDVAFEKPLPSGTYVFACYIPEGGLDEDGNPKNEKAKPHIQLGMINVITVE